MIIPFPPSNQDLLPSSDVLQSFIKRLRPQLTILVELVRGPIVKSNVERLVLWPRRQQEGRIVLGAFGSRREVASEGFLSPLTFRRIAAKEDQMSMPMSTHWTIRRAHQIGANPDADRNLPGFFK
jgi:hypothetical protein